MNIEVRDAGGWVELRFGRLSRIYIYKYVEKRRMLDNVHISWALGKCLKYVLYRYIYKEEDIIIYGIYVF